MKQDGMLMVTVQRWENNGSGDGVTNRGGDRRVVQLRNVEKYKF